MSARIAAIMMALLCFGCEKRPGSPSVEKLARSLAAAIQADDWDNFIVLVQNPHDIDGEAAVLIFAPSGGKLNSKQYLPANEAPEQWPELVEIFGELPKHEGVIKLDWSKEGYLELCQYVVVVRDKDRYLMLAIRGKKQK